MCTCTGWSRRSLPSAASTSVPFQTLQRARQVNVSHFLFTFDLPLSPRKTEKEKKKKEEKRESRRRRRRRRGGGARRRVEGERKKRGEEKWGAGELLLLLSPYLLSLLPFFSFWLSKGKLEGQSFATSSLQPVHLGRYRSGCFLGVFCKLQGGFGRRIQTSKSSVSNTNRRGFCGDLE